MRRSLSHSAVQTLTMYSSSSTSSHLVSSLRTRSCLFLGLVSPSRAAYLAQTLKSRGEASGLKCDVEKQLVLPRRHGASSQLVLLQNLVESRPGHPCLLVDLLHRQAGLHHSRSSLLLASVKFGAIVTVNRKDGLWK